MPRPGIGKIALKIPELPVGSQERANAFENLRSIERVLTLGNYILRDHSLGLNNDWHTDLICYRRVQVSLDFGGRDRDDQ